MRKVLAKTIVAFARFATSGLDPSRRAWTLARVRDRLETMVPSNLVEVGSGTLRLKTPNAVVLLRAQRFHSNEPDTLAWIDEFPDDAVLWDIGANVGQFSNYAAARPGVRVLAFEPAAANYANLNENIELNGLEGRVSAYPLAFAGETKLDVLNMANTDAGGAMHGFGTERDQFGKAIRTKFRQGAVGFSIDEFVRQFAPPLPTHVKIDVDGIEPDILRGGQNTLRAPGVRSMSVEIETPENSTATAEIRRLVDDLGFRARPKKERSHRNVIFDKR